MIPHRRAGSVAPGRYELGLAPVAVGLPSLEEIEARPADPGEPTDEALWLRSGGDVAHRPSLVGIEHLGGRR